MGGKGFAASSPAVMEVAVEKTSEATDWESRSLSPPTPPKAGDGTEVGGGGGAFEVKEEGCKAPPGFFSFCLILFSSAKSWVFVISPVFSYN